MSTQNTKAISDEMVILLKAIAHPVRLAVLDELCQGAKCVADVQQLVDVSQPNLSQHLAALKSVKLIDSYSNGPLRCYYLLNPLFTKTILKELKKDFKTTTRPRDAVIREAKCSLGNA